MGVTTPQGPINRKGHIHTKGFRDAFDGKERTYDASWTEAERETYNYGYRIGKREKAKQDY